MASGNHLATIFGEWARILKTATDNEAKMVLGGTLLLISLVLFAIDRSRLVMRRRG